MYTKKITQASKSSPTTRNASLNAVPGVRGKNVWEKPRVVATHTFSWVIRDGTKDATRV